MRYKTMTAALAVLVALTALASSSYSQTKTAIRLNIPFDFAVRGEFLPAGTYTIDQITASGTTAWRIAGEKDSVMFMKRTDEPRSGSPNVTFTRYGHRYFVSSFQTVDRKYLLSKTRLELALLRKAADMRAAGPETVVLLVAKK